MYKLELCSPMRKNFSFDGTVVMELKDSRGRALPNALFCAIVLDFVVYWCAYNEWQESDIHYHEGRYWMFYSANKLSKEVFQFLTKKQIEVAFETLVQNHYLDRGDFNSENGYFLTTNWYAPTRKTLELYSYKIVKNI